jgi:outer membrane receptor for ferrienterochelin and colicins
MKKERLIRTAIALFASMLLLAWASAASAQTACEDALRDAEKSYELGLFEDVPTKLSPCLGTPTSRAVAIHVHSLLARAYLNNDEPEKARKEVSTLLRLDSTFEAGPLPRFSALVAQVRREELTTQVASVSKTNESLREAPATVMVVTADEIQRRGYLDIEEVLHDLPGFDISRTDSDLYSYIFLRGYRTTDNDRLVFIVDGVEQNELSSNTLYLSRQYPLSNIDRIEVVYGPASTMYGANAYTGVISIITKTPEAILDEHKHFGVAGQITGGGYGGGSADVALAGRDSSGTIAWSISGNFQRSKSRNLSGNGDWDYTYRNIDYPSLMNLKGADADKFAGKGYCTQSSAYFLCDPKNHSVTLTPEGESLVRGLDAAFIRDHNLGFDDQARNWSVFAKLRVSNLTVGLQTWQSEEGIASDLFAKKESGNTTWTPAETAFYIKYTLPLDRVKLNFFSRYVQTTQQRSRSEFAYLHNYAMGYLNLFSLVAPCVAPDDPTPVDCAPAHPWLEQVFFGSLSSQIRNELTLVYPGSERWNGVAGLEFAKSSIQTTFDEHTVAPVDLGGPAPNPEQIEHTDLAAYAQVSYKQFPSLRYVAAGRLNYNEINNKPGVYGFGTLFTPRAAVIYSPFRSALVLKGVYSEAFKDPSDYQKFGTLRGYNEAPSAGLQPEKVKNVELSANWQPNETWSAEVSGYRAHYTNVVVSAKAPGCTLGDACFQYQNRDENLIRGLQVTARYRRARTDIWGSYTRTAPYELHPKDDDGNPLFDARGKVIDRVWETDIAANRMSIAADRDWTDRLTTDLRFRYVGRRRTGEGTSVPDNPFHQMNSYATADASISLLHLLGDSTLQLTVNNIFNEQYFDPTTAIGHRPARILQAGRTFYLRFVYGLHVRPSETRP